jgi:uncharacterized phiE125 gp8 family phage protein
VTLRLITPPANLTVSMATAKSFLRVDWTDEDVTIMSLLKSATETGEELARRAFITQTLEQTFDDWPADSLLTLWRPPLQSVTSVKYTDEDNVEAPWTDYRTDSKSEPGVILFNSLPDVALAESGAITVRFVAGYGNSETDVPERIKQAILFLVAYWYENRETVGEVPVGIRKMFMSERVVWF